MNALEVCHLGLIACLNESVKTCLHKLGNTAAKNCLFAEEVGLSLFSEACLKDTCSACANAASVCKCVVLSLAGIVLMNSDKAGNALSLNVLASYGVSGALGSYHDNVDILSRLNEVEVDVKSVSEHKNVAILHMRSNLLVVDICSELIGNEHHYDISSLCSLFNLHHLEVGVSSCEVSSLLPMSASLAQTDDYVAAALSKVHGMCVTLATEADNGNGLAVEQGNIAIRIIILSDHFYFLLWNINKFSKLVSNIVCNASAFHSYCTRTAHLDKLKSLDLIKKIVYSVRCI